QPPAFSRGGGPRHTRYCAPCLAPISAQRGRDSGAVCVRRWRRNRLRYTKNRSNRLFGGGMLLCAAAVCSCCVQLLWSVCYRNFAATNQSSAFSFRVEEDRGAKDTARRVSRPAPPRPW
ncbi:unnamed protein product, partial [Ectocarpus sp. 6 AP-2014]